MAVAGPRSVLDLPTVILEPRVAELEYRGEDTIIPIECQVRNMVRVIHQ